MSVSRATPLMRGIRERRGSQNPRAAGSAARRGGALGRAASFEDLRELAHLYRLARRNSQFCDRAEAIPRRCAISTRCACAPTRICRWRRLKREAQVGRFYFARFPATLAATAWLQALVAIVLLAGALTGATIVAQNPANIYAAIPSAMYPADDLERLVSSPRIAKNSCAQAGRVRNQIGLFRQPVCSQYRNRLPFVRYRHSRGHPDHHPRFLQRNHARRLRVDFLARRAHGRFSGRGCFRMRSRNCSR